MLEAIQVQCKSMRHHKEYGVANHSQTKANRKNTLRNCLTYVNDVKKNGDKIDNVTSNMRGDFTLRFL